MERFAAFGIYSEGETVVVTSPSAEPQEHTTAHELRFQGLEDRIRSLEAAPPPHEHSEYALVDHTHPALEAEVEAAQEHAETAAVIAVEALAAEAENAEEEGGDLAEPAEEFTEIPPAPAPEGEGETETDAGRPHAGSFF